MKTLAALYLLLLAALLALSCTSEDLPTAASGDLESTALSEYAVVDDNLAKHTPSGPITFTGRPAVLAYYARTGEVILSPDSSPCEMAATLYFLDGQDIVLEANFLSPCDRTLVHEGKMTPSGVIKFAQPDEEIPSQEEHTGCALTGSYPVYHGRYDGTRLYVETQWHGLCTGGNLWGPVFGVSPEKGPIHVNLFYDLTRDGS